MDNAMCYQSMQNKSSLNAQDPNRGEGELVEPMKLTPSEDRLEEFRSHDRNYVSAMSFRCQNVSSYIMKRNWYL